MNKFELVNTFLKNHQEELYQTDFGDVDLSFEKDIERYGIFDTNVYRLNFDGSGDWFWFISVPDLKSDYKKNFDKYPVFFYDSEELKLHQVASNFYNFLRNVLNFDEPNIELFSKNTIIQPIPIVNNPF
jgi:hypothetical protein